MREKTLPVIIPPDPQRSAFEQWFLGLLFEQESCLLRDVLRDSKEPLWKAWQERKPYG